MPDLIPAVFNWSGGKDSTLALHYILQYQEFEVRYLLTTLSKDYNRIAIHGIRQELLKQQVESIGIPLYEIQLTDMPSMVAYEDTMDRHLNLLKNKGIEHAIFGDIFLEDLREYRENQLAKLGYKAIFPLWKRDSLSLIKEFIKLGYKTIVVSAIEELEEFCGRIIDQDFLNDLPKHIDPCGENGEFHTFVIDGPMFNKAIKYNLGERVFKPFLNSTSANVAIKGYWYIDLIPIY